MLTITFDFIFKIICVPCIFWKFIFQWNYNHDTPLCDTPPLDDTPLCDTPHDICGVYVIPEVIFYGIAPKTCCRVVNHALKNTAVMDCPSPLLPTSTFDLLWKKPCDKQCPFLTWSCKTMSKMYVGISFLLKENNRKVADSCTAGIFIRDTACFHCYSMNCDS